MTTTKRIVITGATGLIGKQLVAQLSLQGYEVVVLTRYPSKVRATVSKTVAWKPEEQGSWFDAIDGAYGVVHLAGASVFGKRWSDAYKGEIRDSRIMGTRGIVNAIAAATQKPAVLVSGSAVGYYGFRDDTPLDETATHGVDFLAQVCVSWEAEALKAHQQLGVRTVLLRTGIVLDAKEGALAQLLPPFRMFVGGPVMPGTQWFSWIHVLDEVGIIIKALEDETLSGPVNATAPEPETNIDFCATLGNVLGRPSWLPVPGFGLKVLLGDVGELLTQGQRVIPKKALDAGFSFRFSTAEQALHDLLRG